MGDAWEAAHAAALESMREGEFLVHPHAQVVDGAQDGNVILSLNDDHFLHANLDQETTWEGHASLVGEVAEALGRPPACIVTAVYTSSSSSS